MSSKANIVELQIIQSRIFQIRETRVVLNFHLAELYETETKYLKRAVKRNIDRFPSDFMFELTKVELDSLRCQIGTLDGLGSQTVILETGRGKHPKYLPFAFTEQGVAMLACVLNSPKAVQVNIAIVRAFVLLRQYLTDYKDLKEKIEVLEKEMNIKFEDIYLALNYLLSSKSERKPVGYKLPD